MTSTKTEKALAQCLVVAVGGINIALSELTQVARNLTIAQLAMISSDQRKAVAEITEVHDRLQSVDARMSELMKTVIELRDSVSAG